MPDYKGYSLLTWNDAMSEFYCDLKINTYDLKENQYLGFLDSETKEVIDCYKWQNGMHRPVNKKPVDSVEIGKIRPKNIEQKFAIDMLIDDKTTVKVLTGTYGSGKSFLACACAFKLLQEGKFDKLMWIRNNVEVKNSNPIGYLKGDFLDKMSVWAMPLADHMGGKDVLDMYIERGTIEVEHLGFLRGRDIKRTIILVSEAENLTRQHVQLLLGRVSEGSMIIFDGDCRQVDSRAFESDNGLTALINKLQGNKLFSYVHLNESVRSDTAKLADLLD